MQHKNFSVDFKSVTDAEGEFSALVSVFGNVDRVGDRVLPGAFAKTIKDWEAKSSQLPIVFAHNIENPMMFIGAVKQLAESEHGLVVRGQLDINSDVPMLREYARQAHALLKSGTIRDFSFSYDARGKAASDGVMELEQIDLYEVGPCLVGANPETGLMAIKSAVDVIRASEAEPEPDPKPEPQSDTTAEELRKLYVESLFDF